MAVTAIIIGTQLLRPDVSTSITPTVEAEVTQHPVDVGAPIADHVIRKPRTLALTTVWTPRPDGAFEPSGPDRPQQAFAMLSDAVGKSISVRCDGVTYDPAVLTRCTQTRTGPDDDSRTLSLEFTEILVVSGRTVAVRVAPVARRRKRKVATPAAADAALQAAAEAATADWAGTGLVAADLLGGGL